jgi:hypothetical protein
MMLGGLRPHAGGSSRSADAPAVFLLRPECYEAPFLAAHATELHGVVLLGRHLAPYSKGSEAHREGLRGDELAQDARRAKVEHVHDPDTAVLPLLDGGDEDKRFGRARFMASALSVPTGVLPADLTGEEAVRRLVSATVAAQPSVAFPAPPYFRFKSLKDPWLQVNLRAATVTASILRGRPLAVFIQVDLHGLQAGVLTQAAGVYAKALPGRGVAFLQVAGLDVERTDEESLDAYLNAVAAWRAHGFTVIADRVGRFGVAAVGGGASGMACGTRVYRILPDVELRHQYARSGKVRYWVPGRGDSLPVAEARKRRESLPACPVSDCPALEDATPSNVLRWHDVHLVIDELAAVREDASAFAAGWAASPRNYVRVWGQTLDRSLRRSMQA